MSQSANYLDTQSIFDLIGQHADLSLIFQNISEWLESQIPDSMVSIMLFSEEKQTLNLVSGAKHFSPSYQALLSDLKIGQHVGACGAAAFQRQLVICENLQTDPNWQLFSEYVKQENIHACWSTPIVNALGKLYGTFGTYYRSNKRPTSTHIQLIRHAASLIALSMDLYVERQQRLTLNDKYRSFFTYHPDAIFEHNLEGVIVDANLASETVTKFKPFECIGTHYQSFLSDEFKSVTETAFQQAMAGNSQHLEIQGRNALDESYWLDLTYLPIMQNDQVVGVFGIVRDITERRNTEDTLRLLKRSVDANPHGIILTDASELKIEYVNPAFEKITGYRKEEVLGKNCRILQGPDTDPKSIEEIREALANQVEIQTTIKNYRKNGQEFWNKLILGPVFNDQNICKHFIGIQQDITQQLADSEYIARQQTHDSLTGLINHLHFEKRLEDAFSKSLNQYDPVVLYIELDGFNPLNHSLGYILGDQVLVAVADRLRHLIQDEELISHFSADEFGILLKNNHDLEHVVMLAEQIIKSLSAPFDIDGRKVHISASVGIANNSDQIEKSSQLLHYAIHAVNEAKKQGGNTWHWYEINAVHTPKFDYVLMRHELMVALEQEQFKVVYQPLVDAHSGELKSVEALIRWQHPQKGFISPAEFIPFAEETGQIVAIGQWVLQQACQDIVAWNQENHSNLRVAVNLSPLQFKRAGFLDELNETLKKTQLAPDLLKIEVTEGMLIEGADRSLDILKAVRDLGIKVSVDDFGTGYSSLSYLRTLPADEIKLDRSFIEDLPDNKQDCAIIAAIIVMAQTLGLEVVAEGIETIDQAEFLQAHGCNYFQGFYFAKPAALSELKLNYNWPQ